MPLVSDDFSVGLYLVTNGFIGNVLDLAGFSVTTWPSSRSFVPYPSEVKGFVALSADTTVTFKHAAVMAS